VACNERNARKSNPNKEQDGAYSKGIMENELKITLESIGESEVRLYRSDEKDYTYLVQVTPGHAERFADSVNLAIKDFALLQYEAGERAATARVAKDLRKAIKLSPILAKSSELSAYIQKLEEAAETK
jgi:hypothetical protein